MRNLIIWRERHFNVGSANLHFICFIWVFCFFFFFFFLFFFFFFYASHYRVFYGI